MHSVKNMDRNVSDFCDTGIVRSSTALVTDNKESRPPLHTTAVLLKTFIPGNKNELPRDNGSPTCRLKYDRIAYNWVLAIILTQVPGLFNLNTKAIVLL